MNLFSELEIKTLRLWARQAQNEIHWAFVEGHLNQQSEHGDIGVMPRSSLADEKLLCETETDVNEAYVWLRTLKVGQ